MIMLDEIAAWTFQREPPVFQYARAIRELQCLLHVLLNQQYGDSLFR